MLISEITERVVKSRLSEHLRSNNLLNTHQSAQTKFHCTEMALLQGVPEKNAQSFARDKF